MPKNYALETAKNYDLEARLRWPEIVNDIQEQSERFNVIVS